jgi:hypothetical protein
VQFAVGFKFQGKTGHVVVDAEDALIAALKVKMQRPEALIAYVRQQNKRGDTRHPMRRLGSESVSSDEGPTDQLLTSLSFRVASNPGRRSGERENYENFPPAALFPVSLAGVNGETAGALFFFLFLSAFGFFFSRLLLN